MTKRHRFRSPQTRLPSSPLSASSLVRTIAFAVLVAVAAGWALVRHYTHKLPPLRAPLAPTAAPTYDIEAGEIPVPERLEPDAR